MQNKLNIKLVFLLFFQMYCFSQISKQDFDFISFTIFEKGVLNIKEKDNLLDFFNFLNIEKDMVYSINESIKIDENINDSVKKIKTLYFFELNKNDENSLNFNFIIFSEIKKNEDQRTNYFSILKSKVKIVNKSLYFDKFEIINKKEHILNWFINYNKEYLKITDPIYKTYGFIPPPPLYSPSFLDKSPFELHNEVFKLIKLKKWKDAKKSIEDFIVFEPNESRMFFQLALVKYQLNEPYCKELIKSIKLGLFELSPELREKENVKYFLKQCNF